MNMDMGGMTMGLTMAADMQMKKASNTDVELAMVMTTSLMGQQVRMEEYST